MAYDEGLAERIREILHGRPDVEEKKMFGGLCFMVSDHMACGIIKDTLMARVGPVNYEKCLSMEYAGEMDFTGKAMKGMVYVSPEGLDSDSELASWINTCVDFVKSLPPKKPKLR
ncbi:MAG: TfoX/Sxy family protein [Candidatus Marinimicrobia bacterium]|nr:TfoX/Sxy family protein [Candidatus Neomarinimicrobiota bacterium]